MLPDPGSIHGTVREIGVSVVPGGIFECSPAHRRRQLSWANFIQQGAFQNATVIFETRSVETRKFGLIVPQAQPDGVVMVEVSLKPGGLFGRKRATARCDIPDR